MLQKIMEYLNTIKRYSGRIFMKFERDEGSFEIHTVCVLLGFSLNFQDILIMNHYHGS